ncbi:L-cystine-binding protein FliY [bioreactor metagenome]|uniref:L-cystine-binding protein FliY n=1 Tax=bioreactor metagenome TaxID=1076179 RepID=A0A645C9M7_9ZZZZ
MKKSKKIIALVLAVLTCVVALSLASCTGKDNKKETTTAAETTTGNGLAKAGTFTIGFDPEFPPFAFKNEGGAYTGFDLDLASEVAKKNGWKVAFRPINWDNKDNELASGSIDCIWNGFTMSPARIDKYTWSDPYFNSSQVIVVKADSDIKTLADLKGKTVETQKDSSALEALNNKDHTALKASFKKLVEVSDYNTALMNLDSGVSDAIAVDVGVAKYQIKLRGAEKYRILGEILGTEQYGVGFKKGNEALRDIVQKSLNELAKEGIVKTYADKYGIASDVIIGK